MDAVLKQCSIEFLNILFKKPDIDLFLCRKQQKERRSYLERKRLYGMQAEASFADNREVVLGMDVDRLKIFSKGRRPSR